MALRVGGSQTTVIERVYSIDTSFLMDWQARYYPIDVFVSLRKKTEVMIVSGECSAVGLVKAEIDAVGTPGLRAWVKAHARLFIPMTPEIRMEGAATRHRIPISWTPRAFMSPQMPT